ncbi:MAG: tRNA pseudouridine(38-40) synthase TruA [Candidatus Protistobacter heckmanni]|nr:tRNA pseudouridine(38-40) synthase TruA [Candidatus Protistobacter heckmanni]
MSRIVLGLQYDGTAYSGWQSQPHGNTVQDALEQALAKFAGAPLQTTVAGRTDAGVHALGQVVHFDAPLDRELFSWVRGVNAFLPPAIAVTGAAQVSDAFHARFFAFERTYFYALYVGPVRPVLLAGKAGYLMRPPGAWLDVEAMREAASHLLGEHDFSAFRAAECQAKSPVKTMHDIRIVEGGWQDGEETGGHVGTGGGWLFFRFRASAFLHHMVRNLMGSLIAVGMGRERAAWLAEVLEGRDRKEAAPTFMPDGLYLAKVGYPEVLAAEQGGPGHRIRLPEPNLGNSLFHGVFQD